MSRVQRLERLIKSTEQRLELAQTEVGKIRAELRELLRKLEEAKQEQEQLVLPLEVRGRRPSEKWSSVLNFMILRYPNAVSLDEILHFSSTNNLDISRSALRAQLYHYNQRGIVDRVGDGLYITTDNAKAFCDY